VSFLIATSWFRQERTDKTLDPDRIRFWVSTKSIHMSLNLQLRKIIAILYKLRNTDSFKGMITSSFSVGRMRTPTPTLNSMNSLVSIMKSDFNIYLYYCVFAGKSRNPGTGSPRLVNVLISANWYSVLKQT